MIDAHTTPLSLLQPTQLYISQAKLKRARAYLEACHFRDYDPIPVKKIGRVLFYTDGHTRALLLWRAGHAEIRTVVDEDDMEWSSYLENVAWCRQAGVRTIGDLDARVVDADQYQAMWIDRCERAHGNMRVRTLENATAELETDPEEKSEICASILTSLPEWFGIERANAAYARAVRELDLLVIRVFGVTVGFCVLKYHYGRACELYVLGIAPELHGRGLGTMLVRAVFKHGREKGCRYATVKTLSERHPDPYYARTRAFYHKVGFWPWKSFPSCGAWTIPACT
jgi:ribosomal protein S18 acetylase RimI-like enzyme